jgi:hypothetical protein
VAGDEELREYVSGLEDQHAETMLESNDPEAIPDGDAIAEAFEQFLRDQEG